MWSPGAAMSTLAAPEFENTASRSRSFEAATVTMLGRSKAAGYSGMTSMSADALPAEATTSWPAAPAALIASYSGREMPPTYPQLLFEIRTPCRLA